MNLVRFSHSGEVCFGDLLPSGSRGGAPAPYLIKEGKFLLFLAVWQWIVISLLLFGIIALGAAIVLEKYYKETEADHKVFAIKIPRRNSGVSDHSNASNNSGENDKD